MLIAVGIVAGVLFLVMIVRGYLLAARRQAVHLSESEAPAPEKRRRRLAADYPVDLDSELWKDIKKRVMERDRQICRCCCGHAETVHHLSYDEATLKGKSLKRLISVCNGCHYTIHFDENGKKRRSREMLAVTHQLMRDGKWRYDAM